MKKTTLITFLTLLFLISCSDENIVLKQKIYFEVHYVNYAWFPTNNGFLIDSIGNVLEFNLIDNQSKWTEPDKY